MEQYLAFFVYFLIIPIVFGWILIALSPFAILIIGLTYSLKLYHNTETELEPSVILVVDDEYQSVLPLINLLEQAKVPFKYVKDGFEAINELSKHHFRLILMDFYMPHLTGLETLEEADNVIDESYPTTPVVFYSGVETLPASTSSFRHLSIVDLWSKSMNMQMIGRRLGHILELSPS